MHCGYPLTTSIVAPPLLSLPYAFNFLTWSAGIFCLVIGALLRFGDLARDILVCCSAEVLCPLLGGQCMKAMYLLSNPNGTMKLYEFVVIFGYFMLILAQIPSFHSLRHINLVSLVLCLAYSVCATAASIYIGNTSKGPERDYSLKGDTKNRLFGIFNAIAIIATTYGNGIVPEIQVYLQPTNVVLEKTSGDPEISEFSPRNVISRLISQSLAIITATTIAAMLPFLGHKLAYRSIWLYAT
ncbi:hypothetical protein JHK87_034207 [Glycine soja]|nr:hypothetical protein JHK87_034207 [Glycine soja]